MSNENPDAAGDSSSDRPKKGEKVGIGFPKILMDEQFVMIFGDNGRRLSAVVPNPKLRTEKKCRKTKASL